MKKMNPIQTPDELTAIYVARRQPGGGNVRNRLIQIADALARRDTNARGAAVTVSASAIRVPDFALGARRVTNEENEEVRAAFAEHGWHAEREAENLAWLIRPL
jgi:hypothetical protein